MPNPYAQDPLSAQCLYLATVKGHNPVYLHPDTNSENYTINDFNSVWFKLKFKLQG